MHGALMSEQVIVFGITGKTVMLVYTGRQNSYGYGGRGTI